MTIWHLVPQGHVRAGKFVKATPALFRKYRCKTEEIDREFGACFLILVDTVDSTGRALIDAAAAAASAANACWEWERGGEADPVSVSAALVYQAATVAVEAVTADEPFSDPLDDPQTRRSRLAAAAWMLVLAGTAEGGNSVDLTLASQLFRAAAAS